METFDYIVIGAGSAGCVVAARLSERADVSVLLLEAGGPDSHPTLKMPVAFLKAVINPAFNWGYMTEPEPCLGGQALVASARPRARWLRLHQWHVLYARSPVGLRRLGAHGRDRLGLRERAAVFPEDGNELARRRQVSRRLWPHTRAAHRYHASRARAAHVRCDGRRLQ